MKKYDIPQIEIIHFLTEILVASSGDVQRDYINEVDSLERSLASGAQHEKRMADFTEILQMNNN